MNTFKLTSRMLASLGGTFYPSGHTMLMFASADLAQEAARRIAAHQAKGAEAIQFIPPQVLLEQISPTVTDADNPLPSVGTEGATVRAYTELARQGHCAILVPSPDTQALDAMMAALGELEPSIARRYRALVIEDL